MSAPTLGELVRIGRSALELARPGHLTSAHYRALSALEHCRTGELGHTDMLCAGCGHTDRQLRSCGHRACPRCQHHHAAQWLERQQQALLPVNYFMVTFTVPRQLRALAYRHPKVFYDAMFAVAIDTLRTFAANRRGRPVELGACAVLHTHSRRLDYHPHLHVVVPGGALDAARTQWCAFKGKFLFNTRQLATVFRARLIEALNRAGLTWSAAPKHWVVHCASVGTGLPALKYLSRYLYRGVISERDIIDFEPATQRVTLRFLDSKTTRFDTRTLSLADFLWQLMVHVLPTGYRRVRQYGLLNANARRLRTLVQLVLRVTLPLPKPLLTSVFTCPHCTTPMRAFAVHRPAYRTPP